MSGSVILEPSQWPGAPVPRDAHRPAGSPASRGPVLPAVGIVIASYNHERFVGAAVDSALAQDYPDVHVVVVDDGSTDGSPELLKRYAGRITLICQANAGQLAACRRGAAELATPIVIFLDCDDVLAKNAASAVASAWRPGVSKIQYQLEVIDADGNPLGVVFPKYPAELSPQAVREELLRTGAYMCPPGLGNAYAREVLLALSEMNVRPSLGYADMLYASFAPLAGDVVTLPLSLGQYRVHGNNAWSMRELDIDKVARRQEIELERTAVVDEVCRQRGIPFDSKRALGQQVSYQEHSLALAKFGATGWRSYSRSLAVLGDLLGAIRNSHASLANRSLLSVWACLVTLLPRPLARAVLMQRMAPTKRWHWVERLAAWRRS
jgi:glycosyltransferase involved in cell wall biosynthesis